MKVENHLIADLRLFDLTKEFKIEIGKYENVTLAEISISQLLTDMRKAFNKGIKQLEIDIKNAKEGL